MEHLFEWLTKYMFAATFAKEGIFHEYRKLLENFSEHVSFKKPLGGTFLRSYEACLGCWTFRLVISLSRI